MALPRQDRLCSLLALALLATMALQLVLTARATSATWDEPHHLFDGYTVWTRRDYQLNPEVPPLLKMAAALPLLPAKLNVPPIQGRSEPMEAFLDGRAFVFGNGGDRVLFPARMACAVFALALGWLLFAATRRIFGAPAALFALALFAFDPNFLAHGALVTTDVGMSCLLFAAVYAWHRYTLFDTAPNATPDMDAGTRPRSMPALMLAALAAGLALAVKFTGILVAPTLLALIAGEAIMQRSPRLLLRRLLAFAAVMAVAAAILWSFYGFRYHARPAGEPLSTPLAQYIQSVPNPSDARHLAFLARYHLLPEGYIWGLANTKLTEDADTSYFFGRVYRHGNWKYFPAAFLIKSTLPFLILALAVVPIALCFGLARRPRELLFLTAPVAVYLAVAMSSSMNIGMRHILPIYPFLYALAAGAAAMLAQRSRRWLYLFAALLLWQAATSLRVAPASYMAYANEAWGGPSKTHLYLSDANSDWGQQLKEAKRYLDQRRITNCWFVYFPDGAIEPRDYGIDCKRLPTTSNLWWLKLPMNVPPAIDGTVLISDSNLEGIEFGEGALNPFDSFRAVKPAAVIQHGLFVYDGRFEIPLASALYHAQQAEDLLGAGKPQAALSDAQLAVQLAPRSALAQSALGDALMKLGNPAEAAAHYQAAVVSAETIEPELQRDSLAGLQAKLANARTQPQARKSLVPSP
jgi:tetratricopeptide (TPR) repeat protein